MVEVAVAAVLSSVPDRLIGTPFEASDEAIRAAIADASEPALLMAMVHMTGDMTLLDELPSPAALIAMDLHGAMGEADRQTVRDRAFEVIRWYRDAGCPRPFVPDAAQLRRMLDVFTAGGVTDEYLDYIAADLRVSDADQMGPDLASSRSQRAAFPVVVIGCGEAGILAGIKLKEAGIPFTIVEKRSGPGGTWSANRYPGCRVDIASHYYAYSFEPNDHWSHLYSEQPEILRYLTDVMQRHDISTHTRFETEVVTARWDADWSLWRVVTRDSKGMSHTLLARSVICAVGQFNNIVIPDIEGADSFVGPSFHTAEWPDQIDLAGKRVAVIGAGASGFQLVPSIAPITEQVDVYQRTAQWMAPNVDYHSAVSDGARWAVRHLPYYGRWLRFALWWPITDAAASMAVVDPNWVTGGRSISEANHQIREVFTAWMRAFTTDEDLLEKVIPPYPPMGKRLLQDDGTWLTTLQRTDVELIRNPVAMITHDGVVTEDGVHRPADVLIWATGFDVNHQLGSLDIRGIGGARLGEVWGDSPFAYLGVTVPEFPNFFCMYGPGTNAVNGASIIYNSECQMRYILGCIDMILAMGAKAATVQWAVCADYIRRAADELRKLVYAHPSVTSYYKNSAGDTPTIFPWRIVDYWRWTNRPEPGDYEFGM